MNRTIVTNTGPLIALAAADLLPVLDRLFETVYVPTAIRDEVNAGPHGAVRFDAMASRAHCLEVCPSAAPPPLLQDVLDTGESAVIQVAVEQSVGLVLMDERKGRKVAANVFHLQVVGTVGVLLWAKREGFISSIGAPLASMVAAGYDIHESILTEALRLAGEEVDLLRPGTGKPPTTGR